MSTATLSFKYSRKVLRAFRDAEQKGTDVHLTQTEGAHGVTLTGQVTRVAASRLRGVVRVDVEVRRTDVFPNN